MDERERREIIRVNDELCRYAARIDERQFYIADGSVRRDNDKLVVDLRRLAGELRALIGSE